jgi:hypothetical protein
MEADMKVIRVGQICLLAVLALAAFGASSSSAAVYEVKGLPEAGRCVKVALGKGVYRGAACLLVALPGRGRYEWMPASATEKLTFSGTGEETILKTEGHPTIKCIDANISGEWRGAKTATVEIEFQGCQTPQQASCQTNPQNQSEIKTLPLEAELGFIRNVTVEGKTSVKVGLDLKPQPPLTELATYQCGSLGGETESVEGSVIGELRPINKMVLAQKLFYTTTTPGAQLPQSFQEEPSDTLTTKFTSGIESTSAPSTLKIRNETGKNSGLLEIKAKESFES